MEIKVNFLIAGTQKSGTTALDAYLRLHPNLGMASEKEVHFFDNETYFTNDPIDYSPYHQAFAPKPEHRLFGESTPIYMYWRTASERIWRYNPDMKLILILRNPIERAFSHWNMECSRGAEQLSFWEAITNEQQRCQAAWPLQHRVYSYIDRGFYSKQLADIWRYFPRQNTLLLKHEELKASPQKIVNQVFDFLGVDRLIDIKPHEIFAIPYGQTISPKEKAFLLERFAEEINTLEQQLNWDCTDWKNNG
jgi:hypothetical protein